MGVPTVGYLSGQQYSSVGNHPAEMSMRRFARRGWNVDKTEFSELSKVIDDVVRRWVDENLLPIIESAPSRN